MGGSFILPRRMRLFSRTASRLGTWVHFRVQHGHTVGLSLNILVQRNQGGEERPEHALSRTRKLCNLDAYFIVPIKCQTTFSSSSTLGYNLRHFRRLSAINLSSTSNFCLNVSNFSNRSRPASCLAKLYASIKIVSCFFGGQHFFCDVLDRSKQAYNVGTGRSHPFVHGFARCATYTFK